ncbi:hypothetical protein [Yinghuangia seranimata]|uniref:hypothetical protein n=1 Tax=Yinghuangia seranimata TaxID=408067 RepID=UPI00248A939A|nr:hypothetical protein [Yinghuangia seranimata]MDI2129437.1 hypothetical protein [Yinghuangia seranimata]
MNRTTGQTLTVHATVRVGDVLEIDTRPGRKRVELLPGGTGPGVNTWPAVGSAAMWPLVGGPDLIEVSAAVASPSSSIELIYTPRYLGH